MSQEAYMVADPFDVEIVIKVLSKTLFSPFFVIFIPLTLLSQLHVNHPAFVGSCVWVVLVCLASFLSHVDRVYANQFSWLYGPPKVNWEDQIVLITGGGTGLGALLAETLAMRNVTVVVLTKYPPQFETQNENLRWYICDVSNWREVEKVAETVRNEIGDPTIIINNAGVVKGKLLLDLTEEDVIDTFGVNIVAHFWILKAFLPAILKSGKGHIVNIASVLGMVSTAQMTDYCASKAAAISLHGGLRFELDNRYKTPSIRTTLVLPSHIQTTMFKDIQFPKSRIFRFFAPTLQPHDVVKSIIQALDNQESGTIRLPSYTQIARLQFPGVGILPTWLGDFIQWYAGADHAMRAYGPHPDAAEQFLAGRVGSVGSEAKKVR